MHSRVARVEDRQNDTYSDAKKKRMLKWAELLSSRFMNMLLPRFPEVSLALKAHASREDT